MYFSVALLRIFIENKIYCPAINSYNLTNLFIFSQFMFLYTLSNIAEKREQIKKDLKCHYTGYKHNIKHIKLKLSIIVLVFLPTTCLYYFSLFSYCLFWILSPLFCLLFFWLTQVSTSQHFLQVFQLLILCSSGMNTKQHNQSVRNTWHVNKILNWSNKRAKMQFSTVKNVSCKLSIHWILNNLLE